MRPIELELAGLHSYRDGVRVDFEHLGEHGLFGIFGSIGSGKSTLLDGITLALFGIVDRTSGRSRTGIVNHHSDRVEVRLRFSICPSGEPEVYEVQRTYRRTPAGAIERVTGRLSRLDGQRHEVLADKERELNEAVERLLGLNATDFMRAVVLPQGRFMRFLHLKGSDRRAMLQRIFRLQAYGDGLRKQIRSRRESLSLELEGRRGRLDGLGDASAASIREAKGAAREAASALQTELEQLEGIEAAWQDARRARERQTRLASAQRALSEHRAQLPGVEARRVRLQRADRAHALEEPHERWSRAVARVDLCQEQATTARAHLAESERQSVEGERRHARALADRVASAPALQMRQARLEQALSLEVDRAERAAERETVGASLAAALAEQARTQTVLGALEAESQSLLDRRSELGERLAESQIDSSERERLGAIVRAHDAIRSLDQLVAAQEARIRTERAGLDAARAELDLHLEHREQARVEVDRLTASLAELPEAGEAPSAGPVDDPLRLWNAWWTESSRLEIEIARTTAEVTTAERLHREGTSLLAQATAQGAAITAQLEAARRVLSEVEQRHRAAVLARDLVEGQSCPVCGSEHHPAPAGSIELDPLPVQVLGEAARRADRWVEAAALSAARLETGLQATTRRLAEQTAEHGLAASRCAAARAEVEAALAWPELLAETPNETRMAVEAWLLGANEAHEALQQQRVQVREALSGAQLALARHGQPVAAAEARVVAGQSRITALVAEREELSARLGHAWTEFDGVRGAVTLFDVGRLEARMAEKDDLAKRLVPEIREVEGRTGALQGDLAAARAAAAAAAVERSQLEERLRSVDADLAQIDQRLGVLVPEGAAAAVLAATTARLQMLERAEAEATEVRDAARATLEAARSHATACEAEARSALTELAAASQELDRTLRRLGLPEDEDRIEPILADAMDAETREAERAALADWDRTDAGLLARVEDAESELGDAQVDARAWEVLDRRRTEAVQVVDAARAVSLTAQHNLQDLEARAERYAVLRTEVNDLEARLARLEQLSRLVRGDRFVDYLANDYLRELLHDANRHLTRLTDHRYTLVLGDDGAFEIRDADGGGSVRPVHTLSGGETFVASLALALALSTQVQARSQHPLEFFFLDEGFGSLDAEALDRVMGALEALREDSRTIGLISHLPSVRERVPRYLEVSEPGRDGAVGTTVAVRDN